MATLSSLVPGNNEPPTSNPATPDRRNDQNVLDYDASTNESAVFRFLLPSTYTGGGITVEITWSASSATSGNAKLNTQIERLQVGTDNIDTDSFAAAQTATSAANGTNGRHTTTSIAHSSGAQMDSLVAGEWARLKVTRDAADAGDTMTGDLELLGIVIRDT
jgi:hypothetical protein